MALPKLPPRQQEPEEEDEELGASMTFLEHLEELRTRLIRSLLGFAGAVLICLCISGQLWGLMLKPYYWGIGKERQPILNMKDAMAPTLDKLTKALTDYFQSKKDTSSEGVESSTPTPQSESERPKAVGGLDDQNAIKQLGNTLASHSMLEVFMVYMKLAVVGGIFLAFPIILYQVWRFVAPGLYKREKRFVLPTVISAWICFIFGGLFAYFLVLPMAVYFFSGFSGSEIVNVWSVDRYFTNALQLTLAFGVVFEEPVVIMLLAIVGLVRYRHLKKWRPYVIVIIFVVAAVVTPPDPFSQVACAIPMLILYEISVQAVRLYQRTRRSEDGDGEEDESSSAEATT
jgi:sec-independent protein translocase protein TatC